MDSDSVSPVRVLFLYQLCVCAMLIVLMVSVRAECSL